MLVDPERVANRAVARIAYDAMRWRGEPTLPRFLARSIDTALHEIVEEDADAALDGAAREGSQRGHARFLGELLGLEPEHTHRTCAAFNVLPHEERLLWWSVCVRGERLVDVAIHRQLSVEEVRDRLVRTFELLSRAAGRRIQLPRKVDE